MRPSGLKLVKGEARKIERNLLDLLLDSCGLLRGGVT